jgi:pimeloyl-ACP methyl ester carboxylesterase
MPDFEEVAVTLQSGRDVQVIAWNGSDAAQPMIIVAADSSVDDWHEFVSFLSSSHSPIFADVSSALDLLHLIWEIGEPCAVLSQGENPAKWVSELAGIAPGAISSITICDGVIADEQVGYTQSIATLILRGRQGSRLTHESAVVMQNAISHSTLIEPENCGDFPAKDNPDAAASAVNWFLAGAGKGDDEFSDAEPIDPKA